jgi:uncharacterized protein YjiK
MGLVLGLTGCTGPRSLGGDLAGVPILAGYDWQLPASHCRLPASLDEISGLEHDGRGNLLALHDNGSGLFRVTCVGTSLLNGPQIEGDFEGVTRQDDLWYLLTSPGRIYSATLTSDGLALTDGPHEVAASRALVGRCGFEGIATVAREVLVVACKYPRDPRPGTVELIRLNLADESVRSVRVDVTRVLEATGLSRLRPSGLAWLPHQARMLVLVGKERVLLEVRDSGELVAWRRLPGRWHRQAEGLAALPDGRVAIVDEADGRAASLTWYHPR